MSNVQRKPELWVPIKGYEGLYEISNWGRIKKLPFKLKSARFKGAFSLEFIFQAKRSKSYSGVRLVKNKIAKHFRVNRLTASHFIGDIPLGYEVNHKDLNKQNDYYENLEIITPKENTQHSIKLQGHTGSAFVKVKVQAKNIKTGEISIYSSMSEASRQTGAGIGNISNAVLGKISTVKGYIFTKIEDSKYKLLKQSHELNISHLPIQQNHFSQSIVY